MEGLMSFLFVSIFEDHILLIFMKKIGPWKQIWIIEVWIIKVRLHELHVLLFFNLASRVK